MVTRFAFTSEQRELRDVARDLFTASASHARLRSVIDSGAGYDAALWRQLADDLGVLGIALPTEFGGAGYGHVELGTVMEEAGRALASVPLLSTIVLAATALRLSENEAAQAEHLTAIAAGTTLATLAHSDSSTGNVPEPTVARPGDGGWRLDGTKLFVLDGSIADLLVVSAEVAGRLTLFTVDALQPGLHRQAMRTMDITRGQARIEFHDVAATLLVGPDIAPDVLHRVLNHGRVMLAVEQIGGAEACLSMSVEYAKIREQFGRPIGSFQAIKHRCADMLVEVELAKSTAYNALWALDEDEVADVAIAASMAKAICSDAFDYVAGENIQVHGGIGFSWEHSAHLYFRRARSTAVLLGSASAHRETVAQRLGV